MTTRAERSRLPLARHVVRDVAIDHGVCIRPVAMRRTDIATGETTIIDVPCGSTLASICPPCAEKKKRLRVAQCREGWHLTEEPLFEEESATDQQRALVEVRADLQQAHDEATALGLDTTDLDEAAADIEEQLTGSGVRGTLGGRDARRHRSTRRRQDAPPLPRRKVDPRTVGKVVEAPDGTAYRPSIFLTLTCDTYGKVRSDGTPVNPAAYDYRRAARDAIHFTKLIDRFVQNLRRVVGYDVQYFATVEPQRRLAPHLHMAIRGAISRTDLRMVAAATYHQVWWPSTDTIVYGDDRLPAWDEEAGGYLDPDDGEPLPTWDEALDSIAGDDEPLHVSSFGPQVHAEGVLAGSPQARRCVGYLAKYLTKSVDDCHEAQTPAQTAHVDRLVETLRYEPCSPTCANWLRYGIQPKNARPAMAPGRCKGKAHRREHLGFGGRRVLVSRKWSGKTLKDHKADRKAWVLDLLGIEEAARAAEERRYEWAKVAHDDPAVIPLNRRLLRGIAERLRWRGELDEARARAGLDIPATATQAGAA